MRAFSLRMTWVLIVAAWSVLAPGFVAPVLAQGASDWARTDHSAVRLISATNGVGRELRLGLEFDLKPGWKTYWRSPGDAGFAARLNWSGSENLDAAELLWPAPERFQLFGLDTFGYAGQIVLPIVARPRAVDQPVSLRLAVEYLVCEQICVPYEAALRLDLAAGTGATPTAHAHLINRFMSRVPGDGSGAGLAIERAEFVAGVRPELRVSVSGVEPFVGPDLYVEGSSQWSFGKPNVMLADGGRRATLRLPGHAEPGTAPLASELRLTLVDGERAAERTLVPLPAAPDPAASDILGLAAIVGLAVLGGLILNLMPCVLPVLSLKLLSVIGHAGAARRQIRASFLASAAGIIVAFWVLAAFVLTLRASGHAIGWGIQFQQPVFLAAMTLLVTLFAANLWGWFEIALPSWMSHPVQRATDAAHAQGSSGSLTGSFVTGAFATLLATPCSAPFLGTAVGFALSRGAAEIIIVFSALGLGLALPYLAVAMLPGLAARLPRPGRWMLHLRRVLGAALIVTALWLVTVVAAASGLVAASALLALMAALTALLWAGRHLSVGGRWLRPVGVAALSLLALLVPLQFQLPAAAPGRAAADKTLDWRPFEPEAIGRLTEAGNVVFVDVTADWCITCQVNKAVVVNRGEVARRLTADKIVRMRADWTRPDEGIARYLQSFGRYGIPFNVVYGPGEPEGIPLPEILTAEAVLRALDRARAIR